MTRGVSALVPFAFDGLAAAPHRGRLHSDQPALDQAAGAHRLQARGLCARISLHQRIVAGPPALCAAAAAINHETAAGAGPCLIMPWGGHGWAAIKAGDFCVRPGRTPNSRARTGNASGNAQRSSLHLRIAPVAVLALLAAACSSSGTATTDGSSSFADRFRTAMASGSRRAAPAVRLPGGPRLA